MKKLNLMFILLLLGFSSFAQPFTAGGSTAAIATGYNLTPTPNPSGPCPAAMVGTIWSGSRLNFNRHFIVTFNATFDGSADGVCAVFKNTPGFTTSVGSTGGALGYYWGVADYLHSIGVELDIFNNTAGWGDIADDHFYISRNSDPTAAIAGPVPILGAGINVADGIQRNYQIEWTPPNRLTVSRLLGTALTGTVCPTDIWSRDEMRWITWGFTGATASGCSNQLLENINSSIFGGPMVCVNDSIPWPTVVAGGVWTSGGGTGAVSFNNSAGTIKGVTAGTTVITYTLGGCWITDTVTVNPVPVINHISPICVGNSTTATVVPPMTGGTWSASPGTGSVSINSSTGLITGVSGGTAFVTYTSPFGCIDTAIATVNPLPAPIGGTLTVCQYSTTTLTDLTPGGTWISGNTGIATVGASTGIVTGVALGTAVIDYILPTGCFTSAIVTVTTGASVSPVTMCAGSTATATTTGTGGTWSTSSGLITIDAAGVITAGTTAGTATITYTMPGGCMGFANVNINPLPGAITGTMFVCVGSTTSLSSPTAGGTWMSLDPTVATVSGSGLVSGIAAGTATIDYILPTGCAVTAVITVNDAPDPITGTLVMCGLQQSTTLSDATPGGSWSSSNPGMPIDPATGIVWGFTYGTSTISYTLPSGCAATATLIVDPLPAPVFLDCPKNVCAGSTFTISADPGITGTFTSTFTYVGAAGGSVTALPPFPSTTAVVVAPPTSGAVTIIYEVTGPNGCKGSVKCTFKVNPNPKPIIGPTVICGLKQQIILSDPTPGGTWSSSNTSVAVVNAGGMVTSLAVGTTIISYTLPTGCSASVVVSVDLNPQPFFFQCGGSLCAGTTITVIADPGYTGSYTSSFTSTSAGVSISTLSSTSAVVSGSTAGSITITYEVTTALGCKGYAYCTFDILDAPDPITGDPTVCEGSETTLADAVAGGVWTSDDATIATVTDIGGGQGVVYGVAPGTTTITYSIGHCFEVHTIEVLSAPHPGFLKCGEPGDEGLGLGDGKWIVPWPAYGAGYLVSPVSASPAGIIGFPSSPTAPGMIWITGDALGVATITYSVTDLTTGCIGYAYCTQTVWPLRPGHSAETGVKNVATMGSLYISPNPNNGTFKLSGSVQGLNNLKEVTVEITDVLGKTLMTQTIPVKNGGIDENIAMREVANGVYMVRIKGDHVGHVLRFVVDR